MGKRKSKLASYERRIVLVSKVSDSDIRRSLISRSYISNLESNLDRHIAYLDKLVMPKVPNIKFSHEQFSRGKRNKFVQYLKSGSSYLRAVVNVLSEKYDDKFSHSMIGISHLVEILPDSDRPNGWEPPEDPNSYSASLIVEPQKLIYAIEDICLDIALFHTWAFLSKSVTDNTVAKDFSIKKVEFVTKHHFDSFYGPIAEGCNYISLCSCGRKDTGLDYKTVYRIWKQFLTEFYPSEAATLDTPNQGEKPLIFSERSGCNRKHLVPEQQLEYCTFKGQLPIRIFKEANKLDPGWYILARISKRPKRNATKMQKQILAYFGGTKFRLGKVRFFPASYYSNLRRFFPYIQFFKIRVN